MIATFSRLVIVASSLFLFAGSAEQAWAPAGLTIRTRWAEEVSPERVWPEYPRPMMTRASWRNLNGLWEYAVTPREAGEPAAFDGRILVPFAVESSLSGVGRAVTPDQALWYRRTFEIPPDWKGKRILLHFGAVDWETTVFVNGRTAGAHRGGYDPFALDITAFLQGAGPQRLVVRVWDPTDRDNSPQPRGKQVLRPGGIFYTAVTGIWQTVWLEPVPATSIRRLVTVPDLDGAAVSVTAEVDGVGADLQVLVEVLEGQSLLAAKEGLPGQAVALALGKPRSWSPQSPFLYELKVSLRNTLGVTVDSVGSYFGLRKISVGRDGRGANRLFLNNEPLFQIGPLDQGWWPDGLYTAPTDAALRYDLDETKALGFNMFRKHVKVEPQRLYYWADKLGLLIWQDMPSSLYDRSKMESEALAAADRQWEVELKAMIDGLRNHPSIVMWVPFNEGWGQHETKRIAEWVKAYDPTRLVNNASGWADEGAGDVRDIHSYPGPAMPPTEEKRAVVLGEFGGLGLPVKGHLWKEEGNWGYRSFDDFESYRRKYTDLFVALGGLAKKGLAAAVYTQTTDCEVETNGLMTYDRAVTKLDPAAFAALNRGFLPPLLEGTREGFIVPFLAVLRTDDPAAVTRYTLDGAEPTEKSPRYEAPLTIDRDVTLRARNFWPDGTVSLTTVRTYKRATSYLAALKPEALLPGLAFEFFKGHWTSLPDFAALAPARTGEAAAMDLECAAGEKSDFGLRFRGYIRVPSTDVYVFYVNSDDGSRLRIGGRDVATNDGVHGMTEVRGEIALEEGWHPIELVYFQGTGGLGLQTSYEGPGFAQRPILKVVLGH